MILSELQLLKLNDICNCLPVFKCAYTKLLYNYLLCIYAYIMKFEDSHIFLLHNMAALVHWLALGYTTQSFRRTASYPELLNCTLLTVLTGVR